MYPRVIVMFAREVADGENDQPDEVCVPQGILTLFVQQQTVVTKMWPADMPVKVVLKRDDVRQGGVHTIAMFLVASAF